MAFNISSIKTSSDGIWQGENPLHYAFPLLIIQTTLILLLSRTLSFLLKPLRQPKVIAEILGGILLGPSALGRSPTFLHTLFPSWSLPILECLSTVGLLFFLFLVGLELDLRSLRRSGRPALAIALAGISLPFISGLGVAALLRKTVHGADKVGFPQFFVFMGVALSITAFPVLARILAELKLLTTRVGETAMAAAAFNDVAAWILLALAVALAGDNNKSPLVSVWVLLSGVAFVTFMMVVIRPVMTRVARRCSAEHDAVDEVYICLTLGGVMVSGFVTDLIGIHSIFGAFVFGLTIPKGGDFAERLIERIEDFVSGLLLPLYFASSGLKTDVTKIKGGQAWGLLVLVITTACAGKILGTFVVAVMCRMAVRESLTLGVLMNTKGLVELIVLNIGKEKKVLNDEMFAILVLMALFTTFITTPTVMAIYKPARDMSSSTRRKLGDLSSSGSKKVTSSDQLRVLACVHGPGNVPSIITLIESTRSTKNSSLKLFIMHLVELTERTSSIIMAQRARKNGFPFFKAQWHDPLAGAFQAYSQLGRVLVRPTTAISSLATMHEDICHVAEEKRVTMIILPFHKQWRRRDGDNDDDDSNDQNVEEMVEENVGHAWRVVNQRVLKEAPCSVAVLVDRGFGPSVTTAQNVCVVFFGGPDDREALELGSRMAEHPGVKVTVVRFVETTYTDENDEGGTRMRRLSWRGGMENMYSFSAAGKRSQEAEEEVDEAAVGRKREGVVYVEKDGGSVDVEEEVVAIGRDGGYDLVVVGKGRFPTRMVAALAERTPEHAELGPIGDILASSSNGVKSSVLVVQQHDVALPKEAFTGNGVDFDKQLSGADHCVV